VGHLGSGTAGCGSGHGRALEIDPAGRSGDAAEGRQAADDDRAHEAAGGQDLGIRKGISDGASVADCLHEADAAHRREVLGDRGLAESELVG
jgi:hypothetical protein